MPRSPGLIGGKAIASRINFYIGQYGTLCTLYSLQKPVNSGSAPGNITYAQAKTVISVMIQFGGAANDAAALLGIIDQQVAIGFCQASDGANINDRDILKDATGQFWTVRDLPDTQRLDSALGTKLALVRTLSPPAGVV